MRPAGPVLLDPIELSRTTHPLETFDRPALAELIRERPSELGSISLGRPHGGRLLNAVTLPESPLWHVVDPSCAWGTQETIESIQRGIERVESDHPGSPPLNVGHISRPHGGWLRPHKSHQSGRDVDLGYYYVDDSPWYAAATAANLDRPRTWSLLMGLLTQGNVEYIFITRDVQELLLEYARDRGEDEEWLGSLFDAAQRPRQKKPAAQDKPAGRKKTSAIGDPGPVVRHRWGHHTHLHVRFYSDEACETGRRTFDLLRRYNKLSAVSKPAGKARLTRSQRR